MDARPRILVFDSGLGGLTVFRHLVAAWPRADYLYVADDAGFPYGPLDDQTLVARVMKVMAAQIEDYAPRLVVVACNTASTLALPHLRGRWPQIPFVGTVPAIKPAAAQSRSKRISVLATPGTVARDYTQQLVQDFAAGCEVTLVGSAHLARLAEAHMRGETISDASVAAEIGPCFVTRAGARTDVVTLACTHFPLLLDSFRRLAPWPVEWIDAGPAIARRAGDLLALEGFSPGFSPAPAPDANGRRFARFTSGLAPGPDLIEALRRFGLACEMSQA